MGAAASQEAHLRQRKEANAALIQIESELLQHCQSRLGAGDATGRTAPLPPEQPRTLRFCELFASVVEMIADERTRRVLRIVAEELFQAIFVDYRFLSNPMDLLDDGDEPLSVSGLASLTPFYALVGQRKGEIDRLDMEIQAYQQEAAKAIEVHRMEENELFRLHKIAEEAQSTVEQQKQRIRELEKEQHHWEQLAKVREFQMHRAEDALSTAMTQMADLDGKYRQAKQDVDRHRDALAQRAVKAMSSTKARTSKVGIDEFDTSLPSRTSPKTQGGRPAFARTVARAISLHA